MSNKIKSGDAVYYCGKGKTYKGLSGIAYSEYGVAHVNTPNGRRIPISPKTSTWSTTPPDTPESKVTTPTEVKVGQVWKGRVTGVNKDIIGFHGGGVVFSSADIGIATKMRLDVFKKRHTFVSEPEPAKEKYIIVSTSKHRGQGTIFDSYELAAEHAKKMHHSVLICQVVAESKAEMILEKL